jgi:hypothetical protein
MPSPFGVESQIGGEGAGRPRKRLPSPSVGRPFAVVAPFQTKTSYERLDRSELKLTSKLKSKARDHEKINVRAYVRPLKK